MKKVLGVLIVLAIVVVGFGFYRGWFALSSPSSAAGSNEVNVNLATDTGKIKEDAETVKDKAAELTGSATDEPADPPAQPAAELRPADASPNAEQSKAVETSAGQSSEN